MTIERIFIGIVFSITGIILNLFGVFVGSLGNSYVMVFEAIRNRNFRWIDREDVMNIICSLLLILSGISTIVLGWLAAVGIVAE